MTTRSVEPHLARLGMGLLAVVLVGGTLGYWLLSTCRPTPRAAAAVFAPPALRFVQKGTTVATLDLNALQRLAPAMDVVGPDPYYQHRKHFRALALEPLLVAGFSAALATLQTHDFVLRARDGYAVPMSGQRLLEGGAALAFADVEVADWERIGPQQANPGPFYLVWARPEQGSLATHPRPWQLASIELVDGADLYPHAVPRGVAQNSPAARGALSFRAHCIACHAINREGGRVGPDLNVPQSIIEYRPVAQIRAYIRNPRQFRYGNMPAHPDLGDAQLDELLEYLTVMRAQKYDPEASGAAGPGR